MITDPEAVTFVNEVVRTTADTLSGAYLRAKVALGQWEAKGLKAKFPSDPAEIVNDGSDRDGRTPISGADVQLFMAILQQLISFAEAVPQGGGAPAPASEILKIAVHPT